ncbi:MAG TPA: biotin carboxylase N-terminal domain-containing protein, partial [Gammaproteobacteria bacterium]|nr:biotin carboxylase N-terminal domain-containing protein [Gammaproteobacteria bacterium]
MNKFSTLLVANRGEIASRIFRTAKKMGLKTIAIYTEADRHSPYVNDADLSVKIETSYLDSEAVIAAAKLTGAQAIHPGYGFLSENHQFANSVQNEGIIWVGPDPKSIQLMGDKIEAKKHAVNSKIPILESVTDAKSAKDIGYPLMIKAASGGGGKGMRIVYDESELDESIRLAKQEAKNAFGDDRIFIERFIQRSRHIEVQIIADKHDTVLHLGERECSIQRRHQKIIEESPSSRINPEQRNKLTEASIALAKQINYVSAGTIEFLYDDDSEEFWFLEMNTRLQVEHPVTEMVTGKDIVELQLKIANDQSLDFTQSDISFDGHSIEVRIYAEDPQNHFLPSSGKLIADRNHDFNRARWDSGVCEGMTIGTDFDPMLAKVIVHDETRELAASKLAKELENTHFGGFKNNVDFLINILRDENFLNGDTTTDFIEQCEPLRSIELDKKEMDFLLMSATLWIQHMNHSNANVLRQIPSGWHNARLPNQRTTFEIDDAEITVCYKRQRDGSFLDDKKQIAIINDVTDEFIDIEYENIRRTVNITQHENLYLVQHGRGHKLINLIPRFKNEQELTQKGSLVSPMPGKVTEMNVKVGDSV